MFKSRHFQSSVCLIAVILLALVNVGCASTGFSEYYYLGIYDAQEQLPQEMYRFRLAGYGNPFTKVKFASGWLPAAMVDPIDSDLSFGSNDGKVSYSSTAGDGARSTFKSFRPFYIFGPEGFRKAPQDHRLCIIMSANPEKIFQMAERFAGRKDESVVRNEQTASFNVTKRQLAAIERMRELEAEGE